MYNNNIKIVFKINYFIILFLFAFIYIVVSLLFCLALCLATARISTANCDSISSSLFVFFPFLILFFGIFYEKDESVFHRQMLIVSHNHNCSKSHFFIILLLLDFDFHLASPASYWEKWRLRVAERQWVSWISSRKTSISRSEGCSHWLESFIRDN